MKVEMSPMKPMMWKIAMCGLKKPLKLFWKTLAMKLFLPISRKRRSNFTQMRGKPSTKVVSLVAFTPQARKEKEEGKTKAAPRASSLAAACAVAKWATKPWTASK